MATLSRPKTAPQQVSLSHLSTHLSSSVPAPFPRDLLQENRPLQESARLDHDPPHVEATSDIAEHSSSDVLHELKPSIAYVQKSCLTTLNDLLSSPTQWNPIVPERRHSMPSSPQISTTPQADAESSSALQTLVSNLRNRHSNNNMIELSHHKSDDNPDSELIHELGIRVESISSTLEPRDATLAQALVSLIAHFHRLSILQAASSTPPCQTSHTNSWRTDELTSTSNMFDTLTKQVSDLQSERLSSQHELPAPGAPPVLSIETALLWSRIDEELENVVAMCRERTETHELPDFLMDRLPPQYDPADYDFDTPPEYDSDIRSPNGETKTQHAHSARTVDGPTNEKMRLDLEAVTMAIDRLYIVAPQLHNQRVELKSAKLRQMERASREGASARSSGFQSASRGKRKENSQLDDVRELDNILNLLSQASDRSLKDQSVLLEGGMEARLEKAKLRDMAKRDAFVEQLIQHSGTGRFHGQDAVLQQPRTKDPDALLTLPEFIRESHPESPRIKDPEALLSLPEFVKEPPPSHIIQQPQPQLPSFTRLRSKKNRRRSMSAPTLSWLRPSSRSSVLSVRAKSRPGSSKGEENVTPTVGFEVHYVAENHENLQHIIVFLTVTGGTPGLDIQAEVLPSFPDNDNAEGRDHLIVKSGSHASLPLPLPARTLPGKKEVKVQSGHYEIKLTTLPSNPGTVAGDTVPLLDADQLSVASPTSFICASCSLPLVQSSKIEKYRDLPSEHWQELVDAWMCHADQSLHDQVAKHGRGFWPEPGQALVGGSYILFEDSSVAKTNLCPTDDTKRDEDWQLVRCLCGAVIGRCQEHHAGSDDDNPTVYRLLKYAIRPMSAAITESSKIPLSAFIVEDMLEFVHAHATYRFVVFDEEDERPRILIWLFKPSIRLAYSMSSAYAVPKSASVHAAKVLYKLLKPTAASDDIETILNRYPGFPQAEYLFYPMSICRRLAGLLSESNIAYPESMRTMTGLDVGWLHRA